MAIIAPTTTNDIAMFAIFVIGVVAIVWIRARKPTQPKTVWEMCDCGDTYIIEGATVELGGIRHSLTWCCPCDTYGNPIQEEDNE